MNITQSTREFKTLKGDEHVYHSNVNGNISAGGTLNLHFKNPSGSGVSAAVTKVKVTSTGPMTVGTPHGFSVTGDGTGVNEDCNTVGCSATASCEVYQDATFTSVDHTHEEYVGSGGTGGQGQPREGGETADVEFVVKEDNSYIIQLTNDDSSNAHNLSITIEWYETSTQ